MRHRTSIANLACARCVDQNRSDTGFLGTNWHCASRASSVAQMSFQPLCLPIAVASTSSGQIRSRFFWPQYAATSVVMGKLFVAPVLSGPPYRDPFHSGCDLVRPLALQGYFVDNDTLVGPHATPIQISPGPLTVTSRDEPWDTPKSVEMLPLLAHGPAGFIESYLPGLPEFITFGIRVLGTPVAADDYVAIELDATLIPVRIAHTHLAEINDRQIELQLHLRACFVSCEVNHLFRIVQPPQLALFLRTSTSPSAAVWPSFSRVRSRTRRGSKRGVNTLTGISTWPMLMRYKPRRF
jgi:hypothetical protein